ncbi:7689_t:CDS:2, partial [Funneliformis caledonium]
EKDKKESDAIRECQKENELLKDQEKKFGERTKNSVEQYGKVRALQSEVKIEKAENKKLREQNALLNEYIGELGAEEDYLNLQSRLVSAENILSKADKEQRTRSNSLDLAYSPISPVIKGGRSLGDELGSYFSKKFPSSESSNDYSSKSTTESEIDPTLISPVIYSKKYDDLKKFNDDLLFELDHLVAGEESHDLLPLLRSVLINWATHINSLLSELPEDVAKKAVELESECNIEEHRELVSENARLWEEIRTRGINSGSTTPNNETETSTDRGEKLPSPEPNEKVTAEAVVGSAPPSPHGISVKGVVSSINRILIKADRICESNATDIEIEDDFAVQKENIDDEYKDVEEQIKEKTEKKAELEKKVDE